LKISGKLGGVRDKEQKRSFKNNPFVQQNFYYNQKEDYFVCPMGQHMHHIKDITRENKTGFVSHLAVYIAKCCEGCPMRGPCHKSKGNRKIEVNHKLREYRRKARERLTSEEGLKRRSRRPIEPEAVFGQMKYNKSYNRFRHAGKDKIKMDFAIFAIAFNILKLHRKMTKKRKATKNPYKYSKTPLFRINLSSLNKKVRVLSFKEKMLEKVAA
jgi:hypothetical protein